MNKKKVVKMGTEVAKEAGKRGWWLINKLHKLALIFVAVLLAYATISVKDANLTQVLADLFWKVFGFFAISGAGVKIAKVVKKTDKDD